ncbi:hypothetical protein MLD38_036001 [Melastoma candidum]|uniref:Uncharacterized protein n=1 Tax=Melastoma candidum TaxID=119954 RepID=A0ACB9LHT7_9MYRT|nr:hypothetical protein MLD38_036001 [Melastoma candidum]
MARKSNHQKNGAHRSSSNPKKKDVENHAVNGVADLKIPPAKEVPERNNSGTSPAHNCQDEEVSVEKSLERNEKTAKPEQGKDSISLAEEPVSSGRYSENHLGDSSSLFHNGRVDDAYTDNETSGRNLLQFRLKERIKRLTEDVRFSDNVVVVYLRRLTLNIFKAAEDWLKNQKPLLVALKARTSSGWDYTRAKIQLAYPIIVEWLVHGKNIMLLLLMIWLDCTLRGVDSFLRMGTASFFALIWCGIFSSIAMMGMPKFLLVLVLAALTGVFINVLSALVVVAIVGIVLLWFYGSFWTTALVIMLGGVAFTLKHERLALSVVTIYAVYSAWMYVGWFSLLLGLNLSFISSDALVYFLRHRMSQPQGQNYPPSGEMPDSSFPQTNTGSPQDRSSGTPSTSGANSEATAEDEVIRLLNCSDHYSALGLNRYGNVDALLLKKEYRRKAMLVHPDKNQGNEKAAEAFKKLQNAYEVLLDSMKRKAYDDELKREELLDCLRRFQTASLKNAGHGLFSSGFAHSAGGGEDLFLDSRRIACKRCNGFHVWLQTRKLKSQARWCQECKEFHQAKDGDGWVEQFSQPFLFGLLQKMNVPVAYVCADSIIFDASEWYTCQGMRCPPNTHKPSFHVNTSVMSKPNFGKGAPSGQRGARGMPTPNMEETMTEEEFVEWLQNAVQAGVFDNFSAGNPESPFAKGGSSSKNGSNSNNSSTGGGGGSGKRKKKGKKQW